MHDLLLLWQLQYHLLLMSKISRTRGATFEREIVSDIAVNLGVKTKRNLDQYQEAGLGDIILGNYVIECKRRRKIAVYEFIEQADAACKSGQTPLVVMRADGKKALAVMRWEDILKLLGNELNPTEPEPESPPLGDS